MPGQKVLKVDPGVCSPKGFSAFHPDPCGWLRTPSKGPKEASSGQVQLPNEHMGGSIKHIGVSIDMGLLKWMILDDLGEPLF